MCKYVTQSRVYTGMQTCCISCTPIHWCLWVLSKSQTYQRPRKSSTYTTRITLVSTVRGIAACTYSDLLSSLCVDWRNFRKSTNWPAEGLLQRSQGSSVSLAKLWVHCVLPHGGAAPFPLFTFGRAFWGSAKGWDINEIMCWDWSECDAQKIQRVCFSRWRKCRVQNNEGNMQTLCTCKHIPFI